MVISKQPIIDAELWIEVNKLERVNKINNLVQLLNEDWDHLLEIRSRIEQARPMFISIRKVLCGRELNIEFRMRIVRCYVFSILLYGVES